MKHQSDKLALGIAFAAAIALHAAVLPWVGAAVGREEPTRQFDAIFELFTSDPFAKAGETVTLNGAYRVKSDTPMLYYPARFEVFLSRDRSIDDQDEVIQQIDINPTLEPIEFRINAEKPLPIDADGPYWMIARLSLRGDIVDRDLSNNTHAVPIYIDGPQTPELSVDIFNSPDQALPGGSVLIDFAVTNIGKGWASGKWNDDQPPATHWTDRVYLSTDARLDPADVELRRFDRTSPLKPAGEYRHEQVEIDIPRGVAGPMYLILAADADQVLDQPSFTASVAVRQIELIDTSAPDLIVAAMLKPDRLVINRPSNVAFSIANLGSAATPDSDWFDGLYLSPEPVLDERAVPIGSLPAAQPLQPRSRYESTAEVTLPESIEPGQWFLIVKADAGESVDEPGFEDNNTLAVPIMVLTEEQADAEITLGDPDRPERLVVQWIEHDRVEEHVARLSRTVQPALQDKADPVPDAPLNFDPKPPTVASNQSNPAGDPANPNRTTDPKNQQDARPQPNASDATQTDVAPRPQEPGAPTPTRVDGLPGDTGDANPQRPGIDLPNPNNPRTIDPTPGENDTPSPNPGERLVESPADPNAPDTDSATDSESPAERESDTDSNNPNDTKTTDPSEQPDPTESDTLTKNPEVTPPTEDDGRGDADQKQTDTSTTDKPADDKQPKPDGQENKPAQPSTEQTPTRAPRDPSEAPPVSIEKIEVELQEGKVLVGKGIKVITKLPTPPGTGARSLSIPRNARVRVTFTSEGKVYDARVIKSTTYKEWDAAIEASLYRWRAEGEAIDNAEPYVAIEWNYLLNDLFEDD